MPNILDNLIKKHSIAENHMTKLQDSTYRNSWTTNALYQRYAAAMHTASSDETSMISALASGILDVARASYLGRSLVKIYHTDQEFFTIRLPKEGLAVKTDEDTWSINTKGQRNEYLKIEPRKQLIAGDEWNRTYIENSDFDVLNEQVREASLNMSKLETEVILAKLKELEADAGIAGKVAKSGDDTTITVDTLIKLRGKLTAKDRMPKVIVMHPDTLTTLLQTNDMKSNEYFQHIYDFQNGGEGFMGKFLGSELHTSTLFAADKAYAIDTEVVLPFVLIRDNLITPWMDMKEDKHGIRISTRYGMEFGRKDGFAWWG